MEVPEWWGWELRLTDYLKHRMERRGITEVDLRTMLKETYEILGPTHDRWLALTRHAGRPWAVVLEPDPYRKVIFVVTAYRRIRLV